MSQILQTVLEFEQLIEQVADLMKRSKYKVAAFIEELDMADATFFQKRKRKSWTIAEIKKIAPMLEKQGATVRGGDGENK